MLRNPLALWITRQQKPLKTPQRNWTHVKYTLDSNRQRNFLLKTDFWKSLSKCLLHRKCLLALALVIFTFVFPFKIRVPLVWTDVDNTFMKVAV